MAEHADINYRRPEITVGEDLDPRHLIVNLHFETWVDSIEAIVIGEEMSKLLSAWQTENKEILGLVDDILIFDKTGHWGQISLSPAEHRSRLDLDFITKLVHVFSSQEFEKFHIDRIHFGELEKEE